MECQICIENVAEDKIFNCNACKYKNCIECHKKYLLNSIQDPHCINCRAIIPYDIFMNKFNEKWIFNQYKKHRYSILWEREQGLMPQAVKVIGIKKEQKKLLKKKEELFFQLQKLDDQYIMLNNQINGNFTNMNNPNNKIQYSYTYSCPKENCKGFLNKDYICEVCDITVCKKCYTEIESNLKGPHECDPELVQTFNAIKKEAKPCPTCGEFISKVSGCFGINTPILMFDKTVKMCQDIKIGDLLMGDNNRERVVKYLFFGEDHLFEINQDNGCNFIVNSKHTLVFKNFDDLNENIDEVEMTVEEYITLDENIKKNLKGFKTDKSLSNIKVNYIGIGTYYGWSLDGNKRFLLPDFTVVRNCDQMFCTKCGSAFSWKTGQIEKGIIHNPHAHKFFQENPNTNPNIHANNQCRDPIPSQILLQNASRKLDNLKRDYLVAIHRRIAEFRQYSRHRYLNYINNYDEQNLDIRLKYIKNEMDEKSFKHTLHLRDKKKNFKQQLMQILLFMYDISEILLWNIIDAESDEIILKNIDLLSELNLDTNNNINSLCEKFKYKNDYYVNNYRSKDLR